MTLMRLKPVAPRSRVKHSTTEPITNVENQFDTKRPEAVQYPLPISANSLDPDQDGQNVGSDMDPNCLTL